MRGARRTSLVGAALAAAVTAAVVAAPAASADEPELTLDVLTVVDGEHVVETVTVPALDAAATERSLEARPEVVAADVAVTYQPTGSYDPYWQADGPAEASDVQDVWSRTRGAGQVVAVLDTASSITHEDMQGAVLPGIDVVGGPEDPRHGYGAAGVIAARADNGIGAAGMAPEAKVMPVRVCGEGGCPSAATARGIYWAVDHGADVINMSLAGAGYSDVTAAAVLYALDRNVSVVASAGNDGLNGNAVMYPAANAGVIAVSATTPTGEPADWAQHGWQVDVSTVGESVLLPLPGGYGNASGTSFSGPAVAGAVALLRAGHPGIRTDQVQAALQAGADSTGWNREWGAGRLDVPAAFAAADRAAAGLVATGAPGGVSATWDAVAGTPSTQLRVDGTTLTTSTSASAAVTGLTDGTQVAVDVQPDGGARSAPVLATVGPAGPVPPTLHAASVRSTGTTVDLTLSTTAPAPKYALIRDGVNIGTVSLSLTSTPRTVGISLSQALTYESRWQVRAVDDRGRTSAPSAVAVAGTGRPPAPAAAPTGLTAQLDRGRTLLTWDDLGSAYTYRVSVAGSTVAEPRTGGTVLDAPTAGVSRTYDVAAVDAWGQAGPAAAVQVTGTAPATVPGAPGGVTAVAGDRAATVSWSAAAANGNPVTGYTVTASPGGATVTTTGATTATVTGLTNGTAYTFTVVATNAVGTGPASAASSAVTPTAAPVTPPSAPTSVTAVRGDGRAAVTWTPAAANGSPGTGYRVTASPGGATAMATGGTTATVMGLVNGTAYTFRVTATNAAGTSAPSAASAPVTPAGPPGAPSGLAVAPGDGSITATWSAASANGSPVTGYTVTASAAGGPVTTATTTGALTATVRGLTNGTSYTVSVRATNAVGTGEAGPGLDTVPAVPLTPPAAPTAVTALAGDRQATVSWTPGADNGSPVFEYTVTAFPGGLTADVAGTTATVTGLTNGTAYTFRVAARNAMGTGPASAPSAPVTPRAPTAISAYHEATGGPTGPLGAPVTAERCGLRDGGCYQRFAQGSVYWTATTGAHAVSGAVLTRWAAQKWETGRLGYPEDDAVCGTGGCVQKFQGGSVASSTAGGTRAVWGSIRTRWVAAGAETGTLGFPTSEERCGLLGGGCFQRFAGGTIYWSSATRARVVLPGAVATRWAAQKWETGRLGYPTTDTVCGADGCSQTFQGGSVHAARGGTARAVWGSIRARWVATGAETGPLGYPTSEERCGLRDGGCFQRFAGGTVYWSKAGKAWSVATPVLEAWGAQKWEAGRLGYPVGPATCSPSGTCSQPFQGGTASWSASTPVRFTYR